MPDGKHSSGADGGSHQNTAPAVAAGATAPPPAGHTKSWLPLYVELSWEAGTDRPVAVEYIPAHHQFHATSSTATADVHTQPVSSQTVNTAAASGGDVTEAARKHELCHASHAFTYASPADRPVVQQGDTGDAATADAELSSTLAKLSVTETKVNRNLFGAGKLDVERSNDSAHGAKPVASVTSRPVNSGASSGNATSGSAATVSDVKRSYLYRLTGVVAHVTDPPEKDSALHTINGEHLVSHILVRATVACVRRA